MYRDEIWYRQLEQAIDERRDTFTDKQWAKFQIDHLLKVANRVREYSDDCEICKSYQHTLTRLEEELQELPDSKAQRQYQAAQLSEMGAHFVTAHNLAPPKFFLMRWIKYGLYAGLALGFVAMLLANNLLLLPGVAILITAMAALYGYSEDQKFARERRLI